MKRKIVLFIMALLCALPMFSETGESMDKKQTDANVYGHVIELKTGEHLAYVIVSVKGTTLSTTTDATGHYYMKNLPVGKYVIEVKAMGYRTVTREIETKMHQSQEVNFTLTEDAIALDEVVLTANRSQTLRREAPALVRDSTSSPECARKTIARTVVSHRCVSTDLTDIIHRY